MRKNPFDKVYRKCNIGDTKQKLSNLSEFPDIIDIELTNMCNFKCLFCPTGTKSIKRHQGIMNDEVFYKIIEETKKYNTPIRFIRWGEPTMHPKFIEYIKHIKRVSNSLVHVNTNGSLLSDKIIDELIHIPLDSLKFSFQGVDKKSYEEMRNNSFYDKLLENIKKVSIARGDRQNPYLHVSTSVTYETLEQIEKFKVLLEKDVDLVTVGRTVMQYVDIERVKLSEKEKNTLIKLKEQESLIKVHPKVCPEVYNKLSINWDGTVTACCGDFDGKMIVGDIKHQSLSEIWKCKKMNYYRESLTEKNFDELELCKVCYDYAQLTSKGIQKI